MDNCRLRLLSKGQVVSVYFENNFNDLNQSSAVIKSLLDGLSGPLVCLQAGTTPVPHHSGIPTFTTDLRRVYVGASV